MCCVRKTGINVSLFTKSPDTCWVTGEVPAADQRYVMYQLIIHSCVWCADK